jgi:hypothetical protein
MGTEGFVEAARQCHSKAVYFTEGLSSIPGYQRVYGGEFFEVTAAHRPALCFNKWRSWCKIP